MSLSPLTVALGPITVALFAVLTLIASMGPDHPAARPVDSAPSAAGSSIDISPSVTIPRPGVSGAITAGPESVDVDRDGVMEAVFGTERGFYRIERAFGRFQEVVRVVREHFSGTGLESPYQEMRSAVRLWQMPLVATDRTDRLERCTMPVAEGRTINFSNLARVAEVGLEARATFGTDPILVFCCHNTQEDYTAAGIPTDEEQMNMDLPRGPISLRSNCQGPYAMIDLPPTDTPTADAVAFQVTVIHELGHSPLGRYLADEYDDQDDDTEAVYRGPEPRPRNVGATRDGMLAKWDNWVTVLNDLSGAPRFDPPFVRPAEGAYEHDTGIHRFREACRMRTSGDGEFCEICREELTLGILGHSHFRAGTPATPGKRDISVE